ncbi:MAG TPA: DNA methyltransferase, partial [Edaphobacter sp.]|uniref:site-specific DNA-methyltransferase n=1 Tax=Edaphobacter sp. TaxID=1934404 RepID=UPI002C22F32B
MNTLYYGDNLEVLRLHVKDESVDLVYLDPPFKSNQDYNVLFAEKDGTGAASQFKAFEDTWEWNQAAAGQYQEVVEAGGRVSDVMQAFRRFLGTNDMLAYLTMMAPRLVELRRVLKPTGSIYLHCDPTASHYLKLLMDSIFRPEHFLAEITWRRTGTHSDAKRWSPVADHILHYAKEFKTTWHPLHEPHSESYLASKYRYSDINGRRYRLDNMTSPKPRPNMMYEWKGHASPPFGWRYSRETMAKLDAEGRIWYPDSKSKRPQLKRYLDKMEGVLTGNVWTDIDPINSRAQERLGYPTQKPEILLERMIKASSNEGDIVLDPFCGCGTAIAVAQRLNRNWIGIDITHLAIGLIKSRLRDAFGDEISKTYQVIGEPVSVPDALGLAKEDPYQFQWWALGLVGARRTEQKKGSDQGIDGRLYFHDEGDSGRTKQIILSVKSGHVSVKDIRDLRGVIEREKAEIGVLLTLEDATKPMKTEAASAGFYKSPWGNHPRLQILTIAELLEGKGIDFPHPSNVTF